jgi:hypothetical protein
LDSGGPKAFASYHHGAVLIRYLEDFVC